MQERLVFGVFPFGIAGGPDGLVAGPPDDFGRIGAALQDLAGDGPPLVVRMYVTFEGSVGAALAQVAQFAQMGALVDLSLNFHDPRGDVDAWCALVEQVVRQHGSAVGSIGITNEANLLDVPFAPDGAYPNALEALVDGMVIAAETKRSVGAQAALGFTTAAAPNGPFWQRVADRNGTAFAAAVDFAGLTMYPGAFDAHPPSLDELVVATTELLTRYRAQLVGAGMADVPIRICESGWPTGAGRDEPQQADALATILRTVLDLRAELAITHWELFTLRDADSRSADLVGHFGILRDDYSAKPAYAALRALIRP